MAHTLPGIRPDVTVTIKRAPAKPCPRLRTTRRASRERAARGGVTVRRFFSLIAVAFSLLAGTFSVAFAQDTASPTANNGQQTPGVVYNSDGTEEAQVSTTSIV